MIRLILGCETVRFLAAAMVFGVAAQASRATDDLPAVQFKPKPGELAITIGGQPFAMFCYEDKMITRPYFAHVRAPGGVQVTRNHPPVAGQDLTDHGTFHPGVWLAFGDISGSDYWRIQAPVKFERFTAEPKGGPGRGGFAARLDYRDQRDSEQTVCHEDFRCHVQVVPAGYLILWDSTFSSAKEFAFGDQEEMGLALRTATRLRAEQQSKDGPHAPPGGGEIVSSSGAKNEDEIWGNTADWCDYRGEIDGNQVGIAILCHPKNFRPSWFHARDQGLLVANPFGREAFGKGEKSKVTVAPGDSLRLRYGLLVHSAPFADPVDVAKAYAEYVKLAGD